MYIAAERQPSPEQGMGKKRLGRREQLELILSPFFGVLEKICGVSTHFELDLAEWLIVDEQARSPSGRRQPGYEEQG